MPIIGISDPHSAPDCSRTCSGNGTPSRDPSTTTALTSTSLAPTTARLTANSSPCRVRACPAAWGRVGQRPKKVTCESCAWGRGRLLAAATVEHGRAARGSAEALTREAAPAERLGRPSPLHKQTPGRFSHWQRPDFVFARFMPRKSESCTPSNEGSEEDQKAAPWLCRAGAP
jgi:hypothetical protein